MDELETYHYEQAKRWLDHVMKLKHAVDASKDMMELFASLTDSARGLDISVPKVTGGQYVDRLPDTIIRLEDVRANWEANLTTYSDEAADASRRINMLEDDIEKRALLLHYVGGKTWERVCVQMDYSYDGIMDVRKRAVLHMYDLMPTEWRDPKYNAID